MENRPLVSIVVITYNSSKYVLETLESAKEQTYKNIELIVSDDCSVDNTVEICKEWAEKNKDKFVRIKIVTASQNRGIPANCNRGLKNSIGEWLKIIAGDDILATDCIESFVNYTNKNSEAKIVVSKSQFFNFIFKESNYSHVDNIGDDVFFSSKTKADDQYNIFLRRNPVHGPSVFINRKIVEDVGGFDERFQYIEDHPLWIKLTHAGYKFYFMNKITVFYRVHDSSVFASIGENKIYNTFYLKMAGFDKIYRLPYLSLSERCWYKYRYNCRRIFDILRLNRNNIACIYLFRIALHLNPFRKMQ